MCYHCRSKHRFRNSEKPRKKTSKKVYHRLIVSTYHTYTYYRTSSGGACTTNCLMFNTGLRVGQQPPKQIRVWVSKTQRPAFLVMFRQGRFSIFARRDTPTPRVFLPETGPRLTPRHLPFTLKLSKIVNYHVFFFSFYFAESNITNASISSNPNFVE